MTQIVGALAMGLLFVLISGALRARLLDSLAAAADTLDQCGPSAYVGLAIVVAGGLLLVLTSGPEAQVERQFHPRLSRRAFGGRQDHGKPSKA
jgi:hypothetical protein